MDNGVKRAGQRTKIKKKYRKRVPKNKGNTRDQFVQAGTGVIKEGSWEYKDGQVDEDKNQAKENNSQKERPEGTVTGQRGNSISKESRQDEDDEICMICKRPVGASPGGLFAHLNSDHFKPEWGIFSIETYRRLHKMPNIQIDIHNRGDHFAQGDQNPFRDV